MEYNNLTQYSVTPAGFGPAPEDETLVAYPPFIGHLNYTAQHIIKIGSEPFPPNSLIVPALLNGIFSGNITANVDAGSGGGDMPATNIKVAISALEIFNLPMRTGNEVTIQASTNLKIDEQAEIGGATLPIKIFKSGPVPSRFPNTTAKNTITIILHLQPPVVSRLFPRSK